MLKPVLRTGNLYSPWPEEGNRKLTGALAALHFAPTENSRSNLLNEGIKPEFVHVTGNTVIDALLDVVKKLEASSSLKTALENQFSFIRNAEKLILVTGHRRESFGGGFERICHALVDTAKAFPEVEIVYPVHLNPNVREPINRLLSGIDNIHFD